MIGFGQLTYVPDDNFEQALINLGYDNVLDDYVVTANINVVTSLYFWVQGISDLTGIENFTALSYLDCSGNLLTNLDVSNNLALTELDCANNLITNLDVSNNTALTHLFCLGNQLTSLDVSNNTALSYLDCSGNLLTNLDVSNNTALTLLECDVNQLTSLDVSNNTALSYLDCSGNQLTSLGFSQNTALSYLDCSGNQLTSLDVIPLLSILYCQNNQIPNLYLSQNTALYRLDCSDNQLTSLDVRSSTLNQLKCYNNPNLYCIDVSNPIWATNQWTVANGYISPWNGFSDSCSAEILGCADINACNFDPNATLNNGSCNFPSSPQIVNLNECDSFLWGGVVYDTSGGPYVDTLTTNGGCDSIIYLMLTINISNNSITTINSCDSYLWNGQNYTANGIYTHNTTNTNGCDSTATLDLTINNSTISTDSQTECDSYTWIDGVTYTASNNTATHTVTNAVGCDSIITLDLTVTNSTSSTDVQTACDTYIWIDGATYTTSNNTATFTTTNAVGCDSIITLDLTVTGNPISTITQNGIDLEVTIADTYIWNTGEITQAITLVANGWYWCIVTDANGCIGDTAYFEVINIISAIDEKKITDRELIKITNMLGQETPYRKNTPLFYIYDDGTVEKRIVIE